MAHAISARLARLAARIGQAGLDRDNQTAARHGWQARQIRPGTWRYRDSRFGQPHTTATMAGRRL